MKNLVFLRFKPLVVCLMFIALWQPNKLLAQILSADRAMDWTVTGIRDLSYQPCYYLSILDYGGDPTGNIAVDNAFLAAKNALEGQSGIIFFPAGTYRFNAPMKLTSGMVIRGAGSGSTSFEFNLGGTGNCIQAIGNYDGNLDTLISDVNKGTTFLLSTESNNFESGDYLILNGDDADLMNDSWSYGLLLHLVQIIRINGDTLFLDQAVRHQYSMSRFPRIQKIVPAKNIGIENLKVKRLDVSVGQTRNISFIRVVNSWIRGVESEVCNFGHIVFDMSANCEVTGSYIHHAFSYGSGGKAYGIVLQSGANLNRIENNIFEHLRHSILLQSGANGNVIDYNYSKDPTWTEFPNNAAGDIVLHGNYPFLNLFESNVVQNIRIDQSHGVNGPFNTFLRNRAELYGLIMSNAPASDSQNVLGSEITNSGLFLGNFILAGNGNFNYGNNVRGVTTPSGTQSFNDTSYAYEILPSFLSVSPNWPYIGYPNTLNQKTIPAHNRYFTGLPPLTIGAEPYAIQSDSLIWTNCVLTSDWFDPKNWSQLIEPNPSSDVVVRLPIKEEGIFPNLVIDTSTIHSLKIEAPAILRVESSGNLILKE